MVRRHAQPRCLPAGSPALIQGRMAALLPALLPCRQVESPQQMLMLLTGMIPQDPLPRHLQRHAVRPPSSQRQHRPPLPRRPSQQLLPQQGQQAGAQPPAATQHGQAHVAAAGRPPKPLHQRKPKKPVGQQQQQQATGVAGQHQAPTGNERRHVGVVLEGEGWAAAAVCALPGSQPTTVSGRCFNPTPSL